MIGEQPTEGLRKQSMNTGKSSMSPKQISVTSRIDKDCHNNGRGKMHEDVKLKDEKTIKLAGHEILLAFNNDSGAELFRDFWDNGGQDLFDDFCASHGD